MTSSHTFGLPDFGRQILRLDAYLLCEDAKTYSATKTLFKKTAKRQTIKKLRGGEVVDLRIRCETYELLWFRARGYHGDEIQQRDGQQADTPYS